MSRWRIRVLGVVAWLVVVAIGSTAVWLVISRVGEDLGAGVVAPRVGVAAPGPRGQEVRPGHPISRSPHAGGQSTSSAGPAPSGSSGGQASPLPASSPAPGGSPSSAPPGGSAGASTAGPSGASSPAAAPPARRRTWQGTGGYVTAQCRGGSVSLVAAQPDAGYAVQVGDRGPETLEVSFEGRTEDSGRHVELRARCAGGRPAFRVDSAGGERDG